MLHDLGDRVAYCSRNHEGLGDSQETHHGTYCIMGIKMQSQLCDSVHRAGGQWQEGINVIDHIHIPERDTAGAHQYDCINC